MSSKPFRRDLKCQLSKNELLEAHKGITDGLDELDKIEDRKKDAVKEAKADTDLIKGTLKELRAKVRDQAEVRSVECVEVPIYEMRMAKIIRTDTGEILEHRPLRADELQPGLPMLEGDQVDASPKTNALPERSIVVDDDFAGDPEGFGGSDFPQ